MSIADLATEIFMQKISGSGNSGDIASALTGLLGGNGNDLDIMGLVSKFQSEGLASAVSSWLGDGANDSISTDQVANILGESNISEFASKIGIAPEDALNGLKETIPDMIDKSSSGGSLLDNIGGIDGVMNIAKKFF